MGFLAFANGYAMRLSLSVTITQMVESPIYLNLTDKINEPICPFEDYNYMHRNDVQAEQSYHSVSASLYIAVVWPGESRHRLFWFRVALWCWCSHSPDWFRNHFFLSLLCIARTIAGSWSTVVMIRYRRTERGTIGRRSCRASFCPRSTGATSPRKYRAAFCRNASAASMCWPSDWCSPPYARWSHRLPCNTVCLLYTLISNGVRALFSDWCFLFNFLLSTSQEASWLSSHCACSWASARASCTHRSLCCCPCGCHLASAPLWAASPLAVRRFVHRKMLARWARRTFQGALREIVAAQRFLSRIRSLCSLLILLLLLLFIVRQVGTIGGSYISAEIIHKYRSWHPVFYFFGTLTLIWSVVFVSTIVRSPINGSV